MKRKIMAVSALLAVLLAGGYTVQAGSGGGMGCRGHQAEAGQHGCRTRMQCGEEGRLGHFARMADTLGLSDGQRQEIEAIVKAEQENDSPLMEKIAEGRRLLREASLSGALDEAKIAGLADEQGKLMSEMMVSRIRVKSQIFALLTPEQQKKAEEFCAGCEEGPGCGAGPGCGMGPGCATPGRATPGRPSR